MLRKIIHINEEKCSGCGLCAQACHEGAIGMVAGKAKLLRDDYCDGLGDCLPVCPTGAITFEEREAAAYDEKAVTESRKKAVTDEEVARPCGPRQWPLQLRLVPVSAPWMRQAELLVAADCTAYACESFYRDFIKPAEDPGDPLLSSSHGGRITLIGCPKLDAADYGEKLAAILENNDIRSLTVARMEVPCCGGLERAARAALENSGKQIPFQVVTIATDGRVLNHSLYGSGVSF